MTGFSLSNNYIPDPEALLRKNKSRAASSSITPSTHKPVTLAPSATTEMAQKSLHKFSGPAVANVPTGPVVNIDDKNFELCTRLIMMVQASPFCRLPSEDVNAHLQHFLELCGTIVIKDVALDAIRLHLFFLLPHGEGETVVLQGQ
jgi:hypothetical protein